MNFKMKLSAAILALTILAFAGTAFAAEGIKRGGGDDAKIKAAVVKLHEARVQMHEAKVNGKSEAAVNEAIDNFTNAMGELMKLQPENKNFAPMPPMGPMGHMRPMGPMPGRGGHFNEFPPPPPPPFMTGENFQGPGMFGPHGFNKFTPAGPGPFMSKGKFGHPGFKDKKMNAAFGKMMKAQKEMHELIMTGGDKDAIKKAVKKFTNALAKVIIQKVEAGAGKFAGMHPGFFPPPPHFGPGMPPMMEGNFQPPMPPACPMGGQGPHFKGFPPPEGFDGFASRPPVMRMGRQGFHRGPKNFNSPGCCPACGRDFAGKKASQIEKPEVNETPKEKETVKKSEVWQGKCWRK